jgi:hypothetical protein
MSPKMQHRGIRSPGHLSSNLSSPRVGSGRMGTGSSPTSLSSPGEQGTQPSKTPGRRQYQQSPPSRLKPRARQSLGQQGVRGTETSNDGWMDGCY